MAVATFSKLWRELDKASDLLLLASTRRELLSHFVMPESTDESRRLSPAASVSAEFIELTNVAVANQPEIAAKARVLGEREGKQSESCEAP